MTRSQIGSVVKFADRQWGVYVGFGDSNRQDQVMGVSILVAEYFARLYSTVIKDEAAREILLASLRKPEGIREYILHLMSNYASYNHVPDVELEYNLKNTQYVKKSADFIISYEDDARYFPNFRTRGFGILGKNVESGAVSACLATVLFLQDVYVDDEYIPEIVNKTISSLASKILRTNKLSTGDEVRIVRETVQEVMAEY